MKKIFGTSLLVATFFVGPACAQEAKPAVEPSKVSVGQIGLVAGKEPLKMVLRGDAREFKAGAECSLQPGDKFTVVEVLADGVLVQRKFGVHVRTPSLQTCPGRSIGKVSQAAAFAAVKAQEAAAAKKVVEKGERKK